MCTVTGSGLCSMRPPPRASTCVIAHTILLGMKGPEGLQSGSSVGFAACKMCSMRPPPRAPICTYNTSSVLCPARVMLCDSPVYLAETTASAGW